MSNIDDETFEALNTQRYLALDPHQFYVNNAARLAAKATGLERLAFKIFGEDFIGSIAFALDPGRDFKVDPRKPAPKLRTRIRRKSPYMRSKTITTSSKQISNAHRQTIFGGDTSSTTTSGPTTTKTDLDPFLFLEDKSVDTTNATRNKWEKGGPLEMWRSSLRYSSPSVTRRAYNRNYQSMCNHGLIPDLTNISTRSYHIAGPVATLSLEHQNTLRILEESRAMTVLQAHRDELISRSLPLAPSFTLFRSLAELRDLHRLADLSEIPKRLKERTFAIKDMASLHLATEFGIKPLISDIERMLALPDVIAKRVNYLLERQGKPTSFRRRIFIDEDIGYTPSWSLNGTTDPMFTKTLTSTFSRRRVELRSSINHTFEFPNVELPTLRKNLTKRLWGLQPTASDLYNLIPWSWLIDWFTGLGNYLQAIEAVNMNDSLVNYGYLTYISRGEVGHSVNYSGTYKYTDKHAISGQGTDLTLEVSALGNTVYGYTYHKRVDVSSIGVSTVNGLQNLDDSQSLILSALLAQKAT